MISLLIVNLLCPVHFALLELCGEPGVHQSILTHIWLESWLFAVSNHVWVCYTLITFSPFFHKNVNSNRVPIVYLSLIVTCKRWIILTPDFTRYSIVLQMIFFILRYVPGILWRILSYIFFNWKSCTYTTPIGKSLVKYRYFTRGNVYLKPWFFIFEAEALWWCS
jgi:hypothetical protein